MTPALFLVDGLPAGDMVSLDGEEGRHAARVRRIRVGESVVIGDGRGTLAECVVDAVGADSLRARVVSRREVPLPDPRLVVVQALPKGERAELAVELLTELGVDEIVPWAAAHSVVRWSTERAAKALTRWRRTAAEAAKQSRRAWVPVVGELADTAEVAELIGRVGSAATAGTIESAGTAGRAPAAFVLHEDATDPLTAVELPGASERREIVLVVGPEGGITAEELGIFAAAGATPVRLGEPVLRTSTAGAAALAALSVRLGRW